jgi:hypothetical protein
LKGNIKMACNCRNCQGNRFIHRVTGITDGAITTTNSNLINDKDPYKFFANACILNNLPDTPVAVTVEVNGAQVPLQNKYGVQIETNAIPRKAYGYYSAEPTPHVILVNTPETVTIP